MVVFNVLYWNEFPAGFGNWWAGQLVGHNVVLDLHLYDCFGEASQKTVDEHLEQAREWHEAIERLQSQGHAVIVGEWSLATGVHPGGQTWANAQLEAFSGGLGWFFWNYKLEGFGDEGGDTWSLRGAIKNGITLTGLVSETTGGMGGAAGLNAANLKVPPAPSWAWRTLLQAADLDVMPAPWWAWRSIVLALAFGMTLLSGIVLIMRRHASRRAMRESAAPVPASEEQQYMRI